MSRKEESTHARTPMAAIVCSNSSNSLRRGWSASAFKGRGRLLVLLSLLILCGSPATEAADVKLTPQLAVRGAYDDNILLSRDDKVSSAIAAVTPGVDLDYKTLLSSLTLSADWNFLSYLDESDLNRTNQYYRLTGDHRLKERWTASALFNFYRDTTLHSYLEETGRVIERVERDYLEAGGGLAYDLTTVSAISAAYNFRTADYETDAYNDYDNHNVSLYYSHRLKNERDTLSLGPSYYTRSNDDNDVDSYSLDLGWTRNWSSITRSVASIGGRYVKVKQNDDDSEEDNLGLKANLIITHEGLASTTTFRYFHDLRTTTDGDDVNVDNFLLDYRRLITERFGIGMNGRLVFSYQLVDEQSNVNDQRYYWLEPRLFYNLTPNLTLSAHYRYYNHVEFADDEDVTRERNMVWLQLSYALPFTL